MRLRGLAVVKLEQAAESLTTLHLACSDHRHPGCDQRVAQALVRPFFMIMVDKFPDGRSEMPFAEQHQSVQTLGLGVRQNAPQTRSNSDSTPGGPAASRHCRAAGAERPSYRADRDRG